MDGRGRKLLLIVEDEALIALAGKAELERLGYAVLHAPSGAKALDLVEGRPEIDLVLMDINLGPGMDGTEAAERIIASRGLPVLFLSSHTDRETVEKTERITSYGYVVKSAGATVLDASIKMAFRLHEARAQVLRELAERRRLEEAHRESEERYRLLVERAPVGIFRTDARGRALAANQAMATMLGCASPEEALARYTDLGRQIYVDPGRRAAFVEALRERGSVENFEYEARTADGRRRWFSMNARIAAGGEEGGFLIEGFTADVTERRRAELDLLAVQTLNADLNAGMEWEELLARTTRIMEERFDALHADAYLVSEDRRFLGYRTAAARSEYLRHFERLLGFSLPDLARVSLDDGGWYARALAGEGPAVTAAPADLESMIASFVRGSLGESPFAGFVAKAAAFFRGRAWIVSLPLRFKGDPIGLLDINLRDEPDPAELDRLSTLAGQLVGMLARKRAEESRLAARRRLEAALELALMADWAFDFASGEFTFNDRFYALYGTDAGREGGYRMKAETYAREFLPPEDAHLVADEVGRAMTATDPRFESRLEHRIRRRDGEVRWMAIRFGLVRDDAGRIVGTRGANQDVTDRVRAEEAARRRLAEKETLLRELHHRIRNNLAALSSLLSLRADGARGEFREGVMEARSCVEGTRLLYDMLVPGEGGGAVDAASFLQELAGRIPPLFGREGDLALRVESCALDLDPKTASLLGMALNELLTNVLKHAYPAGEKGRVDIGLEREAGRLSLRVRDDGRGLPPGFDPASSRGLGLKVLELLAEQSGGGFSLDSVPGGTLAVLRFPFPG